MTTTPTPRDSDQLEAIQNVVDRVLSYQESAPDGTVEKELTKAFGEAGLELDPQETSTIAEAIEGVEEGDGSIDVAALLS